MYWLKGCPKCGGDLHGDTDAYGAYLACLQCGHYLTPKQESDLLSVSVKGSLDSASALSVAKPSTLASSAA